MTDTTTDAPSAAAGKPSLLKRLRTPLMIAGPVIVILVGAYFWLTGGRFVSTDNAYVETGRVAISASVSGHVTQLAVHENQHVKKGDLLFTLEHDTAQANVEQARAQLRAAEAQFNGNQSAYRQSHSQLEAARQTLAFRQKELARDQGLLASGVVSKQEVDEDQHQVDLAVQALAANTQQLGVSAANLGGSPDIPVGSNPAVLVARAALTRAEIQLDDTVVRAPQDGIVTKVSQLQLGSYVQATQPVFVLVTDDVWVEANFKEGDLTHMRPGQPAEIKLDAYPKAKIKGVVASLSPGTGSSFSVLPPENATGNWVKVVQRLPVRIALTERPANIPMAAGLSADVKVDTKAPAAKAAPQ